MEEFDQQGMERKRLLSEWLGHNTLLGPKRNNPIKLTRNNLKKCGDIIIIVSLFANHSGLNHILNLRRELPLNSAHHSLLSQMFSIHPMIDRRWMDRFHQGQILWQMQAEIKFL